MLRFRNPGSNLENQILLFQLLYRELWQQPSFDLKSMERVSVSKSLVTAYGHAGNNALEITSKRAESLNSTRMNMKMYAEVFRMLGWVAPANQGRSYPMRFTLLGACVGRTSYEGAFALAQQSALGFVNPAEVTRRVKYSESVRFFPLVLRTLRDLGGIMYKHELCLGPMSCEDDLDSGAYRRMLEYIQNIRGDIQDLKTEFSNLCRSLEMKYDSVDNSTRFPLGLLNGLGWIETGIWDKTLYGRSLKCFRLTEEGESVLDDYLMLKDLRLEEFRKLEPELQAPMIRVGLYSMLERAGFSVGSGADALQLDLAETESFLGGKELLFSPFQTLWPDEVDAVLDQVDENLEDFASEAEDLQSREHEPLSQANVTDIRSSELIFEIPVLVKPPQTKRVERIREEIESELARTETSEEAVQALFDAHRLDKHTTFYPFVSDLFSLMGIPCKVSRAGDNGARWDAIVIDPVGSIPIEIKSPTEEIHLSLKAVRQALENKVVLLSRKTHATDIETASLVVGYELPNARAEVQELINNVYETYGYRIGVIGLRSLLRLAVESIQTGKPVDIAKIRKLKGIVDAADRV